MHVFFPASHGNRFVYFAARLLCYFKANLRSHAIAALCKSVGVCKSGTFLPFILSFLGRGYRVAYDDLEFTLQLRVTLS